MLATCKLSKLSVTELIDGSQTEKSSLSVFVSSCQLELASKSWWCTFETALCTRGFTRLGLWDGGSYC